MEKKVIYYAVPLNQRDTILYTVMKEKGYILLLTKQPTDGFMAIEEETWDVVKLDREMVKGWIRESEFATGEWWESKNIERNRFNNHLKELEGEKSVPKNSEKFGTDELKGENTTIGKNIFRGN